MANFTDEQVLILRENKNVVRVSEYEVSFTPEFQQYAYEQKKQGRRLKDIFLEHGIDPEILGAKRIENFSSKLNKVGREKNGFIDKRSANGKKVVQEANLSLQEQVALLQHRLAYAEQEVEFLKKLQMANTEARKEWESKHQQK